MKTYTTTRGDTWDCIALKELGSEMYMHLLLKENPDHADVGAFSAGVSLKIPDIPEGLVTADSLPPWKRKEQ